MAFGKTDPKEVLGMEPEEFQSKLSKLDSVDSRFEAMEKAQKESTERILAQFEALKPKTPPKDAVDPDLNFLERPSEALDERLAPLSQQTLENTIMIRHREARESYPRDFERWGSEITQKMGELSLQQQADPRVWKAAILMVRGEHAAEIEKDGATGKYGYLEPVSAGLVPDPKTSDNLSKAEREMVRTLKPFGMTAEKYNHGKERLEKARAARLGRFAEVG